MEGLYLYCIREKTEAHPTFLIKGIDEKGEVFVLIHRELEAVVSKVSLEEFGSGEVQKRAQEDLGWIKEKAVAHEKIIEQAMRINGQTLNVIPMKFGTIFKEKVSLEETLNKDYPMIKKVLDKIRGKQEWSIKVYLKDRRIIEQIIEEQNEVIKAKKNEIASWPEGVAFFREEELRDEIVREFDKELKDIVELIFVSFKKHADQSIKNNILAKEISGKQDPMVLNASYLVLEEKIAGFTKEIENFNQDGTKGLYIEYSGPWPAYNFTSIEG